MMKHNKKYNKGIIFLRNCHELLLKIGLLHNDMHLGNVLIDDDDTLYLTDFGNALYISNDETKYTDDNKQMIEKEKKLNRVEEVNWIEINKLQII
jgi:predicted unusual protein kinase regulating ubiquinone biosynthesis (AarF/ABC1/UbiB family)